MRWPRSSESRRRSPRPGSCQRETRLGEVRAVVEEPLQARVKPGSRSSSSGSRTSTANSGIRPTIERTLQRERLAVGQCAARRRRTRPRSSHRLDALAADVGHRVGDVEEVLEELGGDVLVDRVVPAPARARCASCSGSTSPSSRCRPPARGGRRSGSGAQRSKTPMLSRPEEAALEDVAVLRRPCG